MIIFQQTPKNEVPFELLLLADEEKDKIMKYYNDSIYIAAETDDKVIAIIALKEIDNNSVEIVNIAVEEKWQNKKIGHKLLQKAIEYSKEKKYRIVIIKTGNSGIIQLALYQKIGFRITKVNYDYFTNNYSKPIYENNILCKDQIVLKYIIDS